MAVLEGVQAHAHDPSGTCRTCGTSIPLSDLILEKFCRCYYCGKANPFGANWKTVLPPAVVLAALAMLTTWWKQALL
ncbi:MAG: hypothetical protein HXY30_20040 [Pseudorhodoplanes sp.]|nr:hypothetical protein [Pseudorhodoplanes sp.]